jgi:hypothetical protein
MHLSRGIQRSDLQRTAWVSAITRGLTWHIYWRTPQQAQALHPVADFSSGNASTLLRLLCLEPVASVAQVAGGHSRTSRRTRFSLITVSGGNTITFTSAPPSGTNNIYVRYTSPITQVIQPSQGTVQSSSFASGASEFAAGTALLFQQTAAPTGWTKVTSYNDYALRIVSGTASTGGSVAFSSAFVEAVNGTVGTSGGDDPYNRPDSRTTTTLFTLLVLQAT